MFRTIIYPSYNIGRIVLGSMCFGVSVWLGWTGIRVAGFSLPSACNTDTTPTQPHRNSNTHRTKNNTTNVVIQQNSRKLLLMGILMSETCWAHKKWNKIASDIKLVLYSSSLLLFSVIYWYLKRTVNDFEIIWNISYCPVLLNHLLSNHLTNQLTSLPNKVANVYQIRQYFITLRTPPEATSVQSFSPQTHSVMLTLVLLLSRLISSNPASRVSQLKILSVHIYLGLM